MCIAYVIQKNKRLSRDHALNGYYHNQDGSGFSYLEDGEVKTKKGYFDFESLWSDFNAIQKRNKKAKLLHHRISTSALTNEENCHPWQIDKRHSLIHNGIINSFDFNNHLSDTGNFVEEIIKPIMKYGKGDEYKKPHIKYLIQSAVGSYNKIAILDADNTFTLYNEKEWVEENGIFYSNSGYRYSPTFFFETANSKSNNDSNEGVSESIRKKLKRFRYKDSDYILTSKDLISLCKFKKKKIMELVQDDEIEEVVEQRQEENKEDKDKEEIEFIDEELQEDLVDGINLDFENSDNNTELSPNASIEEVLQDQYLKNGGCCPNPKLNPKDQEYKEWWMSQKNEYKSLKIESLENEGYCG